jgi:predicted phosphate transport protein (TIGR00153 family)
MDGDWERTEEVYAKIRELEHRADLIKNDIRDHLPRSLFMPVDRGDILQFLRMQDRIADSAEDIGVLLTMRKTPTPEGMKEGVLALVDSVISTSETWYKAANELTTLEEASFTGPEVDKMIGLINEVRELEREADKRQAEVTKLLFDYEKEIGALSIMLWMNIFRVLGLVANYAESTADLLRLMLAKR